MINNVNETLIGKKVRFVGKVTSEFKELFCFFECGYQRKPIDAG